MENLVELTGLAKKVAVILVEELKKTNITSDLAEVRMYNVRTVGVQGDQRTYSYPVEIRLSPGIWEPEFLAELSNKITNTISEVNRVVYFLSKN